MNKTVIKLPVYVKGEMRKLSFEERQILRKLLSEKKKAIYKKDLKSKLY